MAEAGAPVAALEKLVEPVNVLSPAKDCVPVDTPPATDIVAMGKILQVAFPVASLVKTLADPSVPPVTLKFVVTIDVDVKFPVTKLVELNVPLNVLLPAIV